MIETRWDPIHGYDYTYWPDSKYFKNYRFSPPLSFMDPWSYRSWVWFPYYWSTRRLFQHYMDYKPSEVSIRDVRSMIYINYPYRTLDYYPESTRIYRPLTLRYNYYYPIRSLNYYSDVWPYYPYYRYLYYKYTLPSDRYYHFKSIFDNETSLIRAQTSALLRRIHDPVPRIQRLSWPLTTVSRIYDDVIPARLSSDNYIHKMLVSSPYNDKVSYTTYYTEPIRKYIGTGRLASVSYAGGRAYDRRPHIYLYENPLQSDIQLLSYYINKFRQEKTYSSDSSKADSKKIEIEEKPEITEVSDSQPASD